MMKIVKTVVGALESNSYLVYDDETENALIIDLGGHFSAIEQAVTQARASVKALLLTHGHFDHTAGAAEIAAMGIPVYISQRDAHMLSCAEDSLADCFRCAFSPTDDYRVIKEGEYDIGGFHVKVLETPGHTAGSLCYMIGDRLFAGDTVFRNGYGRYDLPSGNLGDLIKSFKKLKGLSGLKVCCGHGDETLLDDEKAHNPMFRLC